MGYSVYNEENSHYVCYYFYFHFAKLKKNSREYKSIIIQEQQPRNFPSEDNKGISTQEKTSKNGRFSSQKLHHLNSTKIAMMA